MHRCWLNTWVDERISVWISASVNPCPCIDVVPICAFNDNGVDSSALAINVNCDNKYRTTRWFTLTDTGSTLYLMAYGLMPPTL